MLVIIWSWLIWWMSNLYTRDHLCILPRDKDSHRSQLGNCKDTHLQNSSNYNHSCRSHKHCKGTDHSWWPNWAPRAPSFAWPCLRRRRHWTSRSGSGRPGRRSCKSCTGRWWWSWISWRAGARMRRCRVGWRSCSSRWWSRRRGGKGCRGLRSRRCSRSWTRRRAWPWWWPACRSRWWWTCSGCWRRWRG